MKLSSLIAVGSVLTTGIAKNIVGTHSFKFDVTRGDTYANSHRDKRLRLAKRSSPDGTVETALENQSSFYSVEISIGDHNENVTVLMDTGSSDLWVTGSNNPYCSSSSSSSSSSSWRRKWRNIEDFDTSNIPSLGHRRASTNVTLFNNQNKANGDQQSTQPFETASETAMETQTGVSSSQATIDCSEYGTFDVDDSSTYHSNDTEFYIVYGDSSYAYGTWGYDDVTVGGTTVRDLSFAVANQTNSSVGVMGIGLEGLETTYSGSTAANGNSYTYPNYPAKLVDEGIIHKRVYSLYLDSSDAQEGNILFGGVDHAKYNGTLITVPLINTLESSGYNEIIKLEVTLSGIGTNVSGEETTITTTKYPALLDSGTTLTYLPSTVISSIADSIGASYSQSTGYYLTECYGSGDGYIVYDFQGKLIYVPLEDIVLSTSSGYTCVLGLFDSGDDSSILGDSFLRSAYVVYDLDDLTVSLAQAKYTDEEDIEVVTSTIPSASSAADYSSTWSTQQSATSTGDIFTNSDSNAAASDSGDDDSSGSSTRSSSSSTSSSTGSSSDSRSEGVSLNFSVWTIFATSFLAGASLIYM